MRIWIACVLAPVLVGCVEAPAVDGGGADAGPDAGPACGVPPGPYGTSPGSRLRPFEITDCAGEPFAFYGPQFCEARLTFIQVQAGWCGDCRAQAARLQSEIVEPYAPRGVRVLEILIQDDDYGEPDQQSCEHWVDAYGLTNPVLIDPEQLTQIYFPLGVLPAQLIVDSEGVIRHRRYGIETSDFAELRAVLDALLAGSDP